MSAQVPYLFEMRTIWGGWVTLSVALATILYLLYRLALPRPIPGIPYNPAAAQSLLGDLPAMSSHLEESPDKTMVTYFNDAVTSLNAPLVQVFLKPLRAPALLLSDFNEARRLLTQSTEFDRSPMLKGLLSGYAPEHHITLDTDAKWRAQRQLVQDLIKPAFIKNVAGPVVYQSFISVMDAWRVKCRMANGRPWSAGDDFKKASLSAMKGFAFGADSEHDVGQLMLKALSTRSEDGNYETGERVENLDEPVDFPHSGLSDVWQAMADINESVMEIFGTPVPSLKWAYVNSKPRLRKARRCKEQYITGRIQDAISKMEQAAPGDASWVKSAIDQLILREKLLAARDGRAPHYFSRVIYDELFGVIGAGSETIMTILCWLVKLLADHPDAQRVLRAALEQSFPQAHADNRDPTVHEILSAGIPYLDAVLEEGMRCGISTPYLDRQVTVDTEILGHHVPQGTIVYILLSGPSILTPAFEIGAQRTREGSKLAGHASNANDDDDDNDDDAHTRPEVKAWDPRTISQFLPERWLVPGDGEGHGHRFDANAGPQLAFGLGPRSCFGKKVGYAMLRISVALLRWRLQLCQCPQALSSYAAELRGMYEPKQCYVRLRDLRAKRDTV